MDASPIVNTAINPEILLSFVRATWDSMAPASRAAIIEDITLDTLDVPGRQTLIEDSSMRKFHQLPRLAQYYVASWILLGSDKSFRGVQS